MSCNYLIKSEVAEKYDHYIIEGCASSNAGGAVLKYFMAKNPTVKVSNFETEVFRLNAPCTFWVKYLEGLAIFEDKYRITVGKQYVIKNPNLGMSPGNFQEVTAMTSALVESKNPELLPYFKSYV